MQTHCVAQVFSFSNYIFFYILKIEKVKVCDTKKTFAKYRVSIWVIEVCFRGE
jgi:hypothetical protein